MGEATCTSSCVRAASPVLLEPSHVDEDNGNRKSSLSFLSCVPQNRTSVSTSPSLQPSSATAGCLLDVIEERRRSHAIVVLPAPPPGVGPQGSAE